MSTKLINIERVTVTKSLLEIVRLRTCARAHAFLCREEHHLAVPLFQSLRRVNHG